MDKRVSELLKLLRTENMQLSLAESITCGLASHQLSNGIGTSEVFQGGIVCYMPEVKIKVMGVSKMLIDQYTTESQEVTDELVRKLSKKFKSDIYGAVTGLAAPGGSETKNKPVGTVFISVLYRNKIFRNRKLFRGTPLTIKKKACYALYELIIAAIAEKLSADKD